VGVISGQKLSSPSRTTNADRIVQFLRDTGVQHLFGMPGGGSGTDLIAAAGRVGLPFTLAHAETASAFMASAQAEIAGKPGACLATLGPGAASLLNGVANAYLDRVPLIVLTDCQPEASANVMQHQTLRQGEMFSPVVKWSGRLRTANFEASLSEAMAAVRSLPHGPIHLDIAGEVTSSPAECDLETMQHQPPDTASDVEVPLAVRRILQQAKRPLFIAGLGARTTPIAIAIREMCERFGIPALVTYKAKGVVPDQHTWFGGVFTNGALERDILQLSDVIIAVGLDPVELLPRPWKLTQPVISITAWHMNQRQIPVISEIVGHVDSILQSVAGNLPGKSEWTPAELRQLVNTQRGRMRPASDSTKLLPHRVVDLTHEVYQGLRATVDAGAFMFPVMALWPAEHPCGVLISNGLASMGFALPAAIGSALLDRKTPVVAFTGDGGLMMCLAELRTAARESLPLRIIAFDDGVLSLIKIKQIQNGYATDGVSIGAVDWEALGKGLGVLAFQAGGEATLRDRLRNTANHEGPVLIAASITPDTYLPTMRALRG
jgi:acetolactate synthase-1/2/3 large subunit